MTAFGIPSRLPPGWRAEDYLARLADDGSYVTVPEAAGAMRLAPAEVLQLAAEGALTSRYAADVLLVRPAIVSRIAVT